MDYKEQNNGDLSIITLNGPLSNEFVDDVKDILSKSLDGVKKGVIVDLGDVPFMCSAIFGMFYTLHTNAQKNGKKYYFSSASEELEKLFAITGVHRYMNIVKTVDEALKLCKD